MSESWERDPFLLTHRLANGEYSIAGKYNPASIKDQMVRAIALVDRARFHKLIQNPKKLLVVGAGSGWCERGVSRMRIQKSIRR